MCVILRLFFWLSFLVIPLQIYGDSGIDLSFSLPVKKFPDAVFPIQFPAPAFPEAICSDAPVLVPVIMIKNEESVIKQTLQPFVDAGVKHLFVFDTGSTDKTVAMVQEFFNEHHLDQAVLREEPFVDFSTSRNRALELAEEAFPKARLMIMLDAEWYIQNVQGLVKFCEDHKDDDSHCYSIRIVCDNFLDYINHRLLRPDAKMRFVAPVHEYIPVNGRKVGDVPSNIFFAWNANAVGRQKSHKRLTWDAEILEKELKKSPVDGRTLFMLGQTYHGLGNIDKSIECYEKRANMYLDKINEETFSAQYRVAQLYESQGKWEKASHYYMSAYSLRPDRAEPLVALARYYLVKKLFPASYLFAKQAVAIEYPQAPWMIDKKAYDFDRYRVASIAAWEMNDYVVGEDAARKALEVSHKYGSDSLTSAQQVLDCYVTRAR